MKILVLNGSPTRDGNTVALVNAFKEGAESKGHEVTVVNVAHKKVNGCYPAIIVEIKEMALVCKRMICKKSIL